MEKDIISVKLELVDNDDEVSEYKLKNTNGEVITSYSVEWNKTNALWELRVKHVKERTIYK